MSVASNLTKLRKEIPLVSRVGRFFFRNHGVVVHAFGPLLRDFGVQAGTDIATFTRAFERCIQTGGEWSYRAAEASASRLRSLVPKLPNIDEQKSVLIELDRRMQALQNKRDGFGKLFAESVPKSRVIKTSESAKSGDKLIAALGDVVRAKPVDSTAAKLWRSLRHTLPLQSSAVRKAADYAAQHANSIKSVLSQSKLSASDVQKLWGHLVNIRGALGEGYALANKVWQSELEKLMKDARRVATELGESYEARFVTQADHKVLINGLEGPDGMVVIINKKGKEMYLHSVVQVKTAKTSEAIRQLMNDLQRSAGQGAQTGVVHVDVLLDVRSEIQQTFTLYRDPGKVTERLYVINAAESSIPSADSAAFQQMGLRAIELQLDKSVDEFTHLAIDIMEAAAKAF